MVLQRLAGLKGYGEKLGDILIVRKGTVSRSSLGQSFRWSAGREKLIDIRASEP
jgi:hypothetical protein